MWFRLPYGDGALAVELPDTWVGEVVQPAWVEPAMDPEAEVCAALETPMGSPTLAALAAARHGSGPDVVIVSDRTRRMPLRHMLPRVLNELAQAGVPAAGTRIVIALGTHRPMTNAEITAHLGPEIAGRYEIVNTPVYDATGHVYLGETAAGIPAWVNRAVAEAGLRIAIGMITPHLDAGWSGGAKALLPGVCGERTVHAFHAAAARTSGLGSANPLGNVAAPLRVSLERFVAERVPLHFIVNAVVTLDEDLYRCVTGDAIAAHRAGVAHAATVYGAAVLHCYPVVVANCAPYDVDLWQSIKGAWAGGMVVEEGGTLVLAAAAPEGHSNYPLVPGYSAADPDGLRAAIVAGRVDDAAQAITGVLWAELRRRCRVALVSQGLTAADAAAMGFACYPTIEAAVADAVRRLPEPRQPACVAVIPRAGIVLPLVSPAAPVRLRP